MPLPSPPLMLPHSGLVISFMALLALAGTYKLADPTSTAGALRAAGLPGSVSLVRVLGAAEISVGVVGIVWGGPYSSLAGVALYAGFLVFVLEALRRRLPISSCGCLGATETPPTMAHVLVNTAAVITLLIGAFSPIGTLGGILEVPLSEAAAFVVFVVASVYLLQAVLTVLPLHRAVRRVSAVQLSMREPQQP